ncbi:MAG: hypothetical protein GY909_02715 [Oligoflexia bacterium]|nr:hypothetical protein [Oligoflexia bacterium]
MRLPVFQSIDCTEYSKPSLHEAFLKSGLGSFPLYIYLDLKDKEKVLEALETILDLINEMKVNIKFPYPFYVVTPVVDTYEGLMVINNTSQLPKHFVKRIKRLKNREMALLNKSKLILDRLNNHNLEEDIEKIKARSYQNKELYNLTKEYSFYNSVLEKMRMSNG